MSPRHLFSILRAALLVALVTALALALAYQVRSRVVLDIGGTQDTPFVTNFFDAEDDTQQTFRWTRANSEIELGGQALTTPWTLRVRMNGYRPAPQAKVQVYMNDNSVGSFETTDGWKIYTVRGTTPADFLTGDNILSFATDTFIPKKVYQGSDDPRRLGVATDWVQLIPTRSKSSLGNDNYWIDFGMMPVIPPPLTVLSWAFSVGLLYVSARGIGLPRPGINLASAILIVGLAVGFALARPALGFATGGFLNLSLVVAFSAGLVVVFLPRLDARFVPSAATSARLEARSLSILCAIILLSIGLKWGGVWYPQFRSSDLQFHEHRLQFVAQGNLFFTSELPDAVHRIVPYPPALYILLTPFTLFVQDDSLLLLVFNALADAAAILAVYLAARKIFASKTAHADIRPALIAAFFFAFNPVAFWIYSWGNHTNIFGQDIATIMFAVLLTQPLTRPRNFLLALFLFLLAATAHLGIFLSLVVFFPAVIVCRFLARDEQVRRETFSLILLFVIGIVLAWGLYYAEFTNILISQTQSFITDFGAGRTTSGGGGVTAVRVQSVVRSTLDQLGWVLLGLGIIGAPLLWRRISSGGRAIWAAWILVGFLFALVTLGSSFSARYTLWAAPALALSGALAVTWWFKRGRAFQFAAYALCALALTQTVWIWVDRVLNGYH